MGFVISPYFLMSSFLGAGLGATFLAGACFEYRQQKAVRVFMMMMLMYVGWALCNLMVIYSSTLEDKLYFARSKFIALALLPPLWIYFVTELFKESQKKWFLLARPLLFVVPVFVTVACLFPSLQPLIIQSYEPFLAMGIPSIRWTIGALAKVHIVHSYFALVIVSYVCIRGARGLGERKRRFGFLMLASMLIYVIPENIGIHLWPEIRFLGIPLLSQVVSVFVFYYILHRQQVVRSFSRNNDWIFELLPTAAILLDQKFCIMMFNSRASDFFDLSLASAGQNYQKALPGFVADGIKFSADRCMSIVECEDKKTQKSLYFEIICEPFQHRVLDGKGFLVIFKDVTELKKSNQINQRVLSLISHDLLGNLSSLSQLISNRSEKHWDLMAESSRSSVDLIKNILLWSANQGDFYNVNKESTTIQDLVQRSLEQVRLSLITKGITVEGRALIEKTFVYVDIKMFLSILRNILSNAIRFSPRGSVLKLDFQTDGKSSQLCIIDQGPGMKAERIEKILNQSDDRPWGPEAESDGYGIGLFLAVQFLKLHGGRLDISSDQSERGCKVTATFPCLTSSRVVEKSLGR